MTLPEDVVQWLRRLHPDPAWAVVRLFERSQKLGTKAGAPRPVADLVQLPRGWSLILVQPEIMNHVPGVAVITLADGRGFLALDPGRGVADLELALIDRLEAPDCPAAERQALQQMREIMRGWRQAGVRFEERTILVADSNPGRERTAPLSELATAG
jgi:hypothetical protein